jgi:glycosyltransferase involved in cell wall biosynthesis
MNEKVEIVVAMPVFNEAEGIVEFLEEIESSFASINIAFVVVDDSSTDATLSQLERIVINGRSQLHVHRNIKNLGHGPSTLIAIDNSISINPSYVMTVDGDGQFHGNEMRKLFDYQKDHNFEIVEGLRTNRNEPMFRRITSLCTRLLVFFRSHVLPQDANTPLRIYKIDQLVGIRKELSRGLLTPNLHISAFIRSKRYKCRYGTFNVRSLPRRGLIKTGTMWRSRQQMLPSKRFIQFTIKATWQWISTSKYLRFISK